MGANLVFSCEKVWNEKIPFERMAMNFIFILSDRMCTNFV